MILSRRHFLRTTASTALLAGAAPRARAGDTVQPFRHGVASGDPLPNSVVLWTRVSVDPREESRLHWEVARDSGFRDVVRQGEARAAAAHDHTVHVDPGGLSPDTTYFYRFTLLDGPFTGTVSPTGRTWTSPAVDSHVEDLDIAVVSCANWESGHFSAYRDIAQRAEAGDLDVVLALGDYIYEYASGEYCAPGGPVRPHDPPWEVSTLQDYRTRYARYRTDPDLQAAHAALPWVVMWDDHETVDDHWRDGARRHNPAIHGDWHVRKAAARQAYLEWLPVRAGTRMYRQLRFGDLVDLSVLDLRSHRDRPSTWSPADLTDPARSMMGPEQFEWLRVQLEHSAATWTVLGSSVMLSPMSLITLQDTPEMMSVARSLGAHSVTNVPLNLDQWDGFPADRARLLDLVADRGRPLLVLSGDIHSEWGHDIWHRGRRIGVEMAGSSVSALNVNENLRIPPHTPVSDTAEHLLRQANPHLRHVELDSHGYAIARLNHERVQLHWMRVDDVLVPGSPVTDAIMLRWEPGRGFTS